MLAVDGSALGKSCIMHSNRVGLLKAVLLLSTYFGLTNSAMMPLVSCKALEYDSIFRMSWLIFPAALWSML